MLDTNHRLAQNCRLHFILISTLRVVPAYPVSASLSHNDEHEDDDTGGWSLHFLHFADTPKFLQ